MPSRSSSTKAHRRPRIVIVGANFAGLTAAQHLSDEYAVTVIDRSAWFEWLPNIHELLSSVKRPATLRLPRSRLVGRTGHRFVRGSVAAIDLKAQEVTTENGRTFGYDACIVATGGVNDTFGVPGAESYAMPFKTIDHCHAIGRRLSTLAHSPGKCSVVIVGGGLEGVEALGEILRRYRDRKELEVHVVEASPRLLPGTPASLDTAVRARCAPYRVNFHTPCKVTKVTNRHVYLNTGDRIDTDLTIWTGGATAPALLQSSGLAGKPKQWASVTDCLQSRAAPSVFIIGDAAALDPPIGKQAYFAMQMGECAADNVARFLSGKPLQPFAPSAKPMLISLGDLDTFLVFGETVVAAPALAAAKEAVFQLTIAQIDPPSSATAISAARGRLVRAAEDLAIPALSSIDGLYRLLQFDILA